MQIAPLPALGIAAPFVVDTNAANESDPAVDDHQLAMRAMVDPKKFDGKQRIQANEFHPGAGHSFHIRTLQSPRTEPVNDDINLDTRPRPLDQAIDEFRAHL